MVSVAIGIVALLAWLAGWTWLAIITGMLAIAVSLLGFWAGELHGCMPTIIGWTVGIGLGAMFLAPRLHGDALAGAMAGIAIVDMLWTLPSLAMMAFMAGAERK